MHILFEKAGVIWYLRKIVCPKAGSESRLGVGILFWQWSWEAGMREWEESRRIVIRGDMIKVVLRAVEAEIYSYLPQSLQNTIQNCPLGSVGSCLALVEGCQWALCLHGWLSSLMLEKPWGEQWTVCTWSGLSSQGELSLHRTVRYSCGWNHGESSRCNTGYQRIC